MLIKENLTWSERRLVTELITIRDYIRFATSRFAAAELHYGHGFEDAFSEAVYLVLAALHLPQNLPEQYFSSQLTLDERHRILQFFDKRINTRMPVAYLTQEAWFAGMSFYVDQRVLIPRSPLAEVIEAAFEPWLAPEKIFNILDLCTGSGCIALACANYLPHVQVDAADISPDALAVAAKNIAHYQAEEQVHLVQSDYFDALLGKQYDVIISNPPYVPATSFNQLPPEYHHEPRIGLLAGEEGLQAVNIILQEAKLYLKEDDSLLIVEVGESKESVEAAFPHLPFTWLEFARGGEGVFLLKRCQL